MTQNEFIFKHFRSGKKLTSLIAHRHGIFDLPKRICELQEAGHKIKKTWKTVKTRYGNGRVRVVEYSLI